MQFFDRHCGHWDFELKFVVGLFDYYYIRSLTCQRTEQKNVKNSDCHSHFEWTGIVLFVMNGQRFDCMFFLCSMFEYQYSLPITVLTGECFLNVFRLFQFTYMRYIQNYLCMLIDYRLIKNEKKQKIHKNLKVIYQYHLFFPVIDLWTGNIEQLIIIVTVDNG